jgi:2-hydroxy-3-keto-5-methylthiopentenyl-1-phosphate phosphatase
MLILCDFDGTITDPDVTNLVWDRYGLKNWRRELLPPYRLGKKTTLELMDMGWRVIDRSEDELLAYARPLIKVRDGFDELVAFAEARAWPLHVVSNGLDWYIRAFLPPHVPFTSYAARLEDGWRVRLPDGCDLPPGADFKIVALQRLLDENPGKETVFIGDGRNDLPIAREADHVFAVKASTLARLCAKEGLACQEFETFGEVVQGLTAHGARLVEQRLTGQGGTRHGGVEDT